MRTVTVVGHGATSVTPDAAVVHVAATHRARTLTEALAGAESARETIVAVAREHAGSGGSVGSGPSPRFALAAVRFEPGETTVEQQLTVTFELL